MQHRVGDGADARLQWTQRRVHAPCLHLAFEEADDVARNGIGLFIRRQRSTGCPGYR
jgi:hypothetical protein